MKLILQIILGLFISACFVILIPVIILVFIIGLLIYKTSIMKKITFILLVVAISSCSIGKISKSEPCKNYDLIMAYAHGYGQGIACGVHSSAVYIRSGEATARAFNDSCFLADYKLFKDTLK
jgi:hypothetical protein